MKKNLKLIIAIAFGVIVVAVIVWQILDGRAKNKRLQELQDKIDAGQATEEEIVEAETLATNPTVSQNVTNAVVPTTTASTTPVSAFINEMKADEYGCAGENLQMYANQTNRTKLLSISSTKTKEVAFLQFYLNCVFGESLKVDGQYGNKTQAAVTKNTNFIEPFSINELMGISPVIGTGYSWNLTTNVSTPVVSDGNGEIATTVAIDVPKPAFIELTAAEIYRLGNLWFYQWMGSDGVSAEQIKVLSVGERYAIASYFRQKYKVKVSAHLTGTKTVFPSYNQLRLSFSAINN